MPRRRLEHKSQRDRLLVQRTAGGRFAAAWILNAMHAILLHQAGSDLRQCLIPKEREQVDAEWRGMHTHFSLARGVPQRTHGGRSESR